MSYPIEWKPSARKEIRKLDPAVRRRVIEAVTALGDEPRPPGSVTLTGSPGWLRIRIGGYRVIYEVRDAVLVVLVIRVGSRGSVYRRLNEKIVPRDDPVLAVESGGLRRDIAETTFTALAGAKRHAREVRLVVRQVRPTPGSQLALFTAW